MYRLAACALVAACRIGFDDLPVTELVPGDAAVLDVAGAIVPQQITPAPFSTSSAVFVDIPGATLNVPASPDQSWLLLVEGTLGSNGPGGFGAEALYLVDGTLRGIGGSESSDATRPGPWQHYDLVTGTNTAQTIQFQARDYDGGTATIDLRAVLVPLPAASEPRFASSDVIINITSTTFAPVTQLTITPATAGDHLVLLLVTANEAPAGNDVETRWIVPPTTAIRAYKQPREGWQSYLLLMRMTLAAGAQVFTLEGLSGATSRLATARVLALRPAGFPAFAYSADTMPSTTASMTPILENQLGPVTSAAGSYIVVGSMKLDEPCIAPPPAHRGARFAIDSTTVSRIHAPGNCALDTTYGLLSLRTTAPTSITAEFFAGTSQPVEYDESYLVVLGVP